MLPSIEVTIMAGAESASGWPASTGTEGHAAPPNLAGMPQAHPSGRDSKYGCMLRGVVSEESKRAAPHEAEAGTRTQLLTARCQHHRDQGENRDSLSHALPAKAAQLRQT